MFVARHSSASICVVVQGTMLLLRMGEYFVYEILHGEKKNGPVLALDFVMEPD